MKIPVINPFLVMAFAFPTFIALAILNNKDAAMVAGSVIMAYLVYALSREINHDGKPLRIGRRIPVVLPPKREPAIPRGEGQPHQCYICGIIDPKHSEVFGSPLHQACIDWLGPYKRVIEEPEPAPAKEEPQNYLSMGRALRREELGWRLSSQTEELRTLRAAHDMVVQQNRLLRANLENYYSRPPSYYGETVPVHPLDCPCGPCVAVRRAYRESLEFGDFQETQHFLKPASGITFETDGVITYTVQPEEDPE